MTNKLSYLLTYNLIYATALLPLKILYIISYAAYPFVCHILRYRRKTVRRNPTNAFPDKPKEVSIYGYEIVESLAKKNIPIFVFLSHYGNWEWAQEVKKRYASPDTTATIYHNIANKNMNRIMLKIRSRWNGMLLSQDEAVRKILRLQQTGKSFLVGFISDQRPHNAKDNQWITFLNQPTDMVCGAELFGKRCNAAFLYLDIKKTGRGHYRMTFMRLCPSGSCLTPYPYTETYMKMLEQTIIERPEYWLWSHKRWAHADNSRNIIKQ